MSSASHEQPDFESELPTLIRQSELGDESAFARLYDLVAPLAYGLSLRILGNSSAAEEALMDVFSAISKGRPRFDPERELPLVWIATLTRSCSLDRLRATGMDAPFADVPSSVAESTASPAKAFACLRATSQSVRSGLDSLPLDQRTVIEIAYFEGLAAGDIARRVGVSTETVRTRLHQGMMKLRETLGPRVKRDAP